MPGAYLFILLFIYMHTLKKIFLSQELDPGHVSYQLSLSAIQVHGDFPVRQVRTILLPVRATKLGVRRHKVFAKASNQRCRHLQCINSIAQSVRQLSRAIARSSCLGCLVQGMSSTALGFRSWTSVARLAASSSRVAWR